jgi:hypothetical protein
MSTSVVIIPPPSLFERTFDDAQALSSFLEITKLSCFFFGKIYVDQDMIKGLESLEDSGDVSVIQSDLSLLSSTSSVPEITKVGPCDISVYRTQYDSLCVFRASKAFPKAFRAPYDLGKKLGYLKFGIEGGKEHEARVMDLEWEATKLHHLAVFQFVASSLNAHTHTVSDGTAQATALESAVTANLASVLIPSLAAIPK